MVIFVFAFLQFIIFVICNIFRIKKERLFLKDAFVMRIKAHFLIASSAWL